MARIKKYQSDLILDVYVELGQVEFFKVTGIGTDGKLSFRNSLLANLSTPKQLNYARNFTAFVFFDAGGAGGAPEGEYQRVSAFTSTNYEYTLDTALTTALAAGDIIGLASHKLVPLLIMRKKASDSLRNIGQIELVDSSLTTTTATEYTLPAGITKDNIVKVDILNDDRYVSVEPYEVIPALPGTQHTLVVPQCESGYTLYIHYKDYHPELNSYNSVITENLDYPLLVKQLKSDVLDWISKDGEGSSKYWEKANDLGAQELAMARALHPAPRAKRRNKLLNLGTSEDE